MDYIKTEIACGGVAVERGAGERGVDDKSLVVRYKRSVMISRL